MIVSVTKPRRKTYDQGETGGYVLLIIIKSTSTRTFYDPHHVESVSFHFFKNQF